MHAIYLLSSSKPNTARAETYCLLWLFSLSYHQIPNQLLPQSSSPPFLPSDNFNFQLSLLPEMVTVCLQSVSITVCLYCFFFLIFHPAPVALLPTRCSISGAKISSAGSPWGMPAPVPGATSFPPCSLTSVLSLPFLSLFVPSSSACGVLLVSGILFLRCHQHGCQAQLWPVVALEPSESALHPTQVWVELII